MKPVNWPASQQYSIYTDAIIKKLDTLRAFVVQAKNCSTTQEGRRNHADCGSMSHVNQQINQIMAFIMGNGDTCDICDRIDADTLYSLRMVSKRFKWG